jgi:hypothetical protein
VLSAENPMGSGGEGSLVGARRHIQRGLSHEGSGALHDQYAAGHGSKFHLMMLLLATGVDHAG